MKRIFAYILLLFCYVPVFMAQSLSDARELYLNGKYAEALPVFESEYNAKPNDVSLNHWYGVCLYETGGNPDKAVECLTIASKRGIQDSFLYLGRIYTKQYKFSEAQAAFDDYESRLTKNTRSKKKDELEKERLALEKLDKDRAVLARLRRMATNVEDIQIIDSVVVDKDKFLSAYKLSFSSGRIKYFNQVFETSRPVNSTVYFNEKETKIYYAQPDTSGSYTLYSMEKLLDDFGNEKRLSANNFGLKGDVNYPFMMPDGVTIYFSAKDEESVGGYDLFVSRYNMNNDTFLTPERMNMPFNSDANDYMMVVDEEKGVGWFATDRFQPEGKVCVYTFIPNESVKMVESDDEQYQIRRALITSIRDTWVDKLDYNDIITVARSQPVEKKQVRRDFEFVVDDSRTYYFLTDFKSKEARDVYFSVIQLKRDLVKAEEDLERKRGIYTSATQSDKRNLTDSILMLEKQVEKLREDILRLEVKARNIEIESER